MYALANKLHMRDQALDESVSIFHDVMSVILTRSGFDLHTKIHCSYKANFENLKANMMSLFIICLFPYSI